MLNRREFFGVACGGSLAAMAPGLVPLAMARENPTYVELGAAIRGADPVAFFTQNRAVEGRSTITYEWNYGTWRFVSVRHRNLFAANPERYAPQFGGYCAFALGRGMLAPTEPPAYVIHEGRLYLAFNRGTMKRFKRKLDENIAKAEKNWPTILG